VDGGYVEEGGLSSVEVKGGGDEIDWRTWRQRYTFNTIEFFMVRKIC
jgi:Cu2+-containing amine oxidase